MRESERKREHEGKKTGKCDVRLIESGDRERLVIDASRSRMEDKFIRIARGMRQKRRGRVYTSMHRSRISDINLTR